MNNKPDHYYIQQTLAGNTRAFSNLVLKYQNMVFTIALKMVKNREQAEDVAQEAFVKCYQSLKNFKGSSKFSTWLYRITYNHCLDTLKKKANTFFHDSITEEKVFNKIDDTKTGLDIVVTQEQHKFVHNAIKKLPESDQLLITLYYFDELSVKEIAKIVGLKENNIKIRLHRVRAKLVSLLKPSEALFK